MSETRIYSHDQHLAEIRQKLFQHGRGSCRVNRNSYPSTQALDALHCAMQILFPSQ